MALSRIGASAGDGTTITIPGTYQNGDAIIIYAFAASAVVPSLPAGWTNINTGSGGVSGFRIGWKLATSAADTSGTWTSATGLICHVYRGQATNKVPFKVTSSATATSALVTYGVFSPLNNGGTSWVLGFAATKTTTSTLETAPTNMTNASTAVGAATEYAGHDTNGVYTVGAGGWPATTVNVGVSAEWREQTIELLAEQGLSNNYQFVKASDNGNGVMSVTEKIR